MLQRLYTYRSAIYTAFFGFLFAILPNQISIGCGPVFEDTDGYSFLNPAILKVQSQVAPFLFDFSKFQSYYVPQEELQAEDNVREWQQRFCEVPDLEDIAYVIYKSSESELELLRTAIESKAVDLPLNLRENSFANHLYRTKCIETVNYLVYAKACEPHVIEQAAWGEERRDVREMARLIQRGYREFMATKSHYIRLRYAYQMVRLAHYMKDYNETIRLYDDLLPKIDADSSLIYYWMLGHRAGALRGLGQTVQASYEYGVVFKNCPSKRESAFRSFLIKTDEEWNQCLLLCKDDGERAALYTMRASNRNAQVVEEMENIYRLQPQTRFLEILLVREIRELEKQLLGQNPDGYKRISRVAVRQPDKVLGERIIRLQAFARRMREEQKVAHPVLWHVAEGYLEFLAGDYYAADRTLTAARKYKMSAELQEQLDAFALAAKIASYDRIDNWTESRVQQLELSVDSLIRNTDIYKQYPDFRDYLYDKFANIYRQAGHPGKAFRCHYSLDALKPNPQPEILEDLLEIARNPNSNRFERQFVTHKDGTSQLYDLIDIKATDLMARGEFQVALNVYKEIPRAEWDRFGSFKPFVERLNDCINCRVASDTSNMYNRGQILEALINADIRARTGEGNMAQIFYTLGNGLYNMSYFGYAWNAMDYFRSGSSYSSWNLNKKENDFVFYHYYYPFNNKENMDVTRARSYYEQSRATADALGNRELAAKAAFMAAKCEQKQYFTSGLYESPCKNCIPRLPEQYLTNFRLLRNVYFDTEFFKRAVQECKYFQVYASK